MNLIIDIGNTASKFVVFEHSHVLWQFSACSHEEDALRDAFSQGSIDRIIVSAVGTPSEELRQALDKQTCPILWLTTATPLPIINHYDTPQTLGVDRLAAVVGAQTRLPHTDVLVIDAGTCITYDLIDSNGNYLGGNISPGLRLRFEAMHNHTAKLPIVAFDGVWPPFMAKNTKDALLAGVMYGVKAEVEMYIENLRKEMPKLKVILTGGDGIVFKQSINKTDVEHDEMLVARGLNRILEYNED